MIHSTVNLPYVGGVATSRTTSSPSLNFGYVIRKYFLPSLVTWVSLWRFSLKWRLARMCLKTNSKKAFCDKRGRRRVQLLEMGCQSVVSNKPVTTGVKPATWLHVAGYSGHNNQLLTNNLDCNSCLLFQSQAPTSKYVETTGCQLSTNCYVVNSHEKPILIVKMYVGQ